MAVEKLPSRKSAEIGSRQEALEAISPSRLDIFYRPIFEFFQKNRLFQQPLLLPPAISKCDKVVIIPVAIEKVGFPVVAVELRAPRQPRSGLVLCVLDR